MGKLDEDKYYHVLLQRSIMQQGNKPNYSCEINLTKDHIINDYVIPYRSNKKLICDGDIFEASELIRLRLYFTSDKIDNMTDHMEVSGYLHNKAEDVTRESFDEAKQILIEPEKPSNSDQIFIVHGHDTTSKLELARLIEKDFGLSVIILHEQANKGNTIIEKLERLSELPGYIFVILTPDAIGANNDDGVKTEILNNGKMVPGLKFEYRARQNVLLEMGYFMGKLGRDRVCCLYNGVFKFPLIY